MRTLRERGDRATTKLAAALTAVTSRDRSVPLSWVIAATSLGFVVVQLDVTVVATRFAPRAAVAGYLVGAFGGGWLVSMFSSASDRSTEAAMTGAFVYGPAVACAAFLGTLVVTGRSRPA